MIVLQTGEARATKENRIMSDSIAGMAVKQGNNKHRVVEKQVNNTASPVNATAMLQNYYVRLLTISQALVNPLVKFAICELRMEAK